MDNVVDTKEIVTENKKYRIKIVQDPSPESPREWDNLGTMVCVHPRYNLGDEQTNNRRDYSNNQEYLNSIIKNKDICVILPLYLYDHSGVTMNTTGFSCQWDTTKVGWIFVSKEKVRKEYNVKRINKELVEKVTKILVGEVETYDQYLQGDVYGYEIYEVDTCDLGCEHETIIDSCWGYYGTSECLSDAEIIVNNRINETVLM